MRFSRDRWSRGVYVRVTNANAEPLVEAGWLEQRTAYDDLRSTGRGATEYRLTEAGAEAIRYTP
jgi:hypothetical protein